MSRYSALKAIINQDITNNGQGDITGAILNQVLKDMVDSLGAYFQFAGIATPTTNPGNPDQRVFYIATIAGAYTNFGSMAVPNGISILKFDESWTLETLDLSSYLNNVVADGVVDGTRISATTTTNDRKTPNAYSAGSVFTYYDSANDSTYYYVALTNGTAGTSCSDPTKFFATTSSTQAVYQAMLISSVIATSPQSFTPVQKEQAAANIGLGVVVKGDVQQSFSAEQKVQAQNNVFGKAYSSDASDHSGLGKVYLQKNNGSLTQAMMQVANTVYVIQYDYTMSGNINVPVGCILEFDGGSISSGNYTLTGDNTRIKAERTTIFPVTKIAGTWNVGNIYSEWFGDVTQNNNIKKLFALTADNITNNVYIAVGTYNVSALANEDAIIIPKSNTIVHLSGTIQLAANAFTNYRIINIENVSNVTIEGGNIIGDRDTHTGTTGEWGMGINIGDAHDISVRNVNVTKCWGDGIYVGGSGNTYNISIDSFTISDCRRQGISVTEVDNATINNGKISKIDGTLPKACIDIEPNANDITRNITLSNLYCDNYSAGAGRGIILYGVVGTIENINIKNCSINARYGLAIERASNVSIDGITLSQTLYVVNGSYNVSFTNTTFSLLNLEVTDSNAVQFSTCKFEFSTQDVTVPAICTFDDCRFNMTDYILNLYASLLNCQITTNRYVKFYNAISKNVTLNVTKGVDRNNYPLRIYNAEVQNLSLNLYDSQTDGSMYAYLYGESCVIDGFNINSEITPSMLCYSGDFIVLKDLSFVNSATAKYNINEDKAVVTLRGFLTKGTTAQRPYLGGFGRGVYGYEYFDLTLMKPTYWTGDISGGKSGWVDATGANVPNS